MARNNEIDDPFSVLAVCGGTAVAYEIARQLSARGRVPELFTMITDWHAPFLHPETHTTARHVLRQKWRRINQEGIQYLTGILHNIPWRIKTRYLSIRRKFELRALKMVSQNGKPLSKALQTRAYLERA